MTDQIRADDTALSGGLDDKVNIDHVEDGIVDDKVRSDTEEERTWPRLFQKKTMWKVDLMILPLVILLYMCASFDKSNLGNAKTLGMMKDITVDKDGKKYAFLTSLYYIGYSPFMIPCALLGKRTRLALVIACSGIYWGIASTGFAGVQNISGAYACRFLVGMGAMTEAGFSPLIPFYLARWYTREDLGSRVGLWLSMAPLGGFLNGIIPFGVSYIKSRLESWRILFLIEGCSTLFLGIMGVIFLPDDIPTARFLTAEEKEFLLYRRRFEIANETHHINWRHALRAIYSWPVLFPVLMYSCFQISGAALLAYLPTFTSENGFTGAMAQIATLAPYGSAAVVMNIVYFASDRWRNRAWGIHIGNALTILGLGMYLGCKATMHHARFAALVFAETVANPLILTWCASNSGNESKRAVAIPLTIAVAQALSIASGYLFPSTQGPKYTTGSAVCLALSIVSTAACFLYQWLIRMENHKRDAREGKPPADHRPDTNTYADKAAGFRYQP